MGSRACYEEQWLTLYSLYFVLVIQELIISFMFSAIT